jgi:putative membrane protein
MADKKDKHRSSLVQSIKHNWTKHHRLDDKLGQTEDENFFQKCLFTLQTHRGFLFSSLLFLIAWSCLCVWAALMLQKEDDSVPDGIVSDWLQWLDGAGDKLRLMGTLFAFSVVFRFNRCYDRWNQGRIIWGQIIATSSDVTRMASNWIIDEAFANRFCRFVVVFAYASKALLRGNSLADLGEEGEALIEREFLTREELEDMNSYEGWQPQYCLDMLDCIWIEAHYVPDTAIMFDSNHKVHSQLFRAIQNSITKLGASLGDAIRLRASGLPETYDSLHHLIFYAYFMLSSVFYAPSTGWALPILIGVEAFIIMLISVLGTDLVQPFGTDRVDLPLALFCRTIEVQVKQIREPNKTNKLKQLARTSNTRQNWSLGNVSTSISRGIKDDHKKVANTERRLSQFPKPHTPRGKKAHEEGSATFENK